MGSAPETGRRLWPKKFSYYLLEAVVRAAVSGCERLHRPCRSPPQSKTSPVSVSNDGIEPVSPAGANSEPDMQGGASYPSEQAEQG